MAPEAVHLAAVAAQEEDETSLIVAVATPMHTFDPVSQVRTKRCSRF